MHVKSCEGSWRTSLPHPQPFSPREKGAAVNDAPDIN
jgi:hypothetical protein